MKLEKELLSRITIIDGLMSGKATIRANRFTVADVIEMLATGMTNEEILEQHPVLELDDIEAAILYSKNNDIYKRHYPLDKPGND